MCNNENVHVLTQQMADCIYMYCLKLLFVRKTFLSNMKRRRNKGV